MVMAHLLLTLLTNLNLLVLHRIDGLEVIVSPSHITSLRILEGSVKHLAPGNCMVYLTDGKAITTLETCRQIQQMLDK